VELLETRITPVIPGSPNQNFVNLVYLDLLSRPPDASGLAGWTGLLNQGASRNQVAADIQNSNEYRTDEIEDLYHNLLGRSADPVGLTNDLAMLAAGGPIEQIAISIYTSPEFYQLSGSTPAGFLRSLYQDQLGRSIDPSGLMGWECAISSGASLAEVVTAIFAGPENLQRQVQLQYGNLLQRTADPVGLTHFVGVEQQSGILGVINGILGSGEYFGRAQENPLLVPSPTTTTLLSSANPSALDQSVTFTATISPNVAGGSTATGPVTFMDGNTLLGTTNLNAAGSATFTIATLPAGQHAITASYGGDANFTASASAPLIQTVNQQATMTTLTVSPSPSGNMAILTADVSPSVVGPFAATGLITFSVGTTVLGKVSLQGGTAQLMVSPSVATMGGLLARYSGDTNFAPSANAP